MRTWTMVGGKNTPLEKVLQRLSRQFSSHALEPRPPDAAGSVLGGELARSLHTVDAIDLAVVWKALCRATHMPASVPEAFMDEMITRMCDGDLLLASFEWIPQWLTSTEELVEEQGRHRSPTGLDHLLAACIRGYAAYAVTSDPPSILHVYQRLRLSSTQSALWRRLVTTAVASDKAVSAPAVLSPLLAAGVLNPAANHPAVRLHVLWRSLWIHWTTAEVDECRQWLSWMTHALDIYLTVLSAAWVWSDVQTTVVVDVAENWMVELAGLASALALRKDDDDSTVEGDAMHAWLDVVWYRLLPQLALLCGDCSALLQSLQLEGPLYPADASATLRLAVAALSSVTDRAAWLALLRSVQPTSTTSLCLLRTVADISVHERNCRSAAAALTKSLQVVDFANDKPNDHCTLLKWLDLDNTMVATLIETCDFAASRLSPAQQIGSMLLGVVLLDDERRDELGFTFLGKLLLQYPHLAISLMPPMMDRVNQACNQGDGRQLLRYMEFVTDSLVRDPHCAGEIWNLLGVKLMQSDVPLAVRVAIIRLYPKLCSANKRLYNRVIESLGASVTSRQPEVRLAVAATLADLALEDLIRDVSDVIGWLQMLLTEERTAPIHSLLVHYAILTLHYLVVAGELDFDVVVKVLNKRLCVVADAEAVMALPIVVQESLVLLLGDGEVESGDSSEEDDENAGPQAAVLSPQVTGAVRTLVRVASSLLERSELSSGQSRVLHNCFKSLSAYSLGALGVDDDCVKEVVARAELTGEQPRLSESVGRYVAVRDVVVRAMKNQRSPQFVEGESDPVVLLARKVIAFEEDTLGTTIWSKQGRRALPKEIAANPVTQAPSLSILPEPSDVRDTASVRATSPGTAVALLLVSDGARLSTIRDNGDAALESTDPVLITFAMQAYLHVSACAVSKAKDADVGTMVAEVRSWFEVFVSPDTMYLALSTLSIYIPVDSAKPESSGTQTEEIFDLVMDAYRNQRFEKREISRICLGLIAVSSLRDGSLEGANEIISTLIQSVRGYGGVKCFGAYYGLAIIGQGLHRFIGSAAFRAVEEEAKPMIFTICGFLVEELLSCYEEYGGVFINLIACLKSGKATADLVDSMQELDVNSMSLLMTKQVEARNLFISCALCLPGLATLNGALHLATLRMMEAFEWGGGKGIALPPMLNACAESKLFDEAELQQIYRGFAETFEDRMGDGKEQVDAEGLEDIFYALNCTQPMKTPHIIRRALVGNHDLFDDDGCVMSLVAISASIAPLPCLGASYFAFPIELRKDAVEDDVRSIVEILEEVVDADQAGKYSYVAILLLALLSSLRNRDELSAVAASVPLFEAQAPPIDRQDSPVELDFRRLPSAARETALGGILDMAALEMQMVTATGGLFLTRFMASLECLSIPDQFAKFFIDPLMQLGKAAVTEGCVSLLCSQLSGRRRAALDAKQFAALALDLARVDRARWDDLRVQSQALLVFTKSLPEIIKRFPSDSPAEALKNVWSNCFANISNDPSLVVTFLSSTKAMLSSTTLPPKAMSAVRQVVEQVSADLHEMDLSTLLARSKSGVSVLGAYGQCLQEMPHADLDEDQYINILKSFDDLKTESIKAILLSSLVTSGYFNSPERDNAELEKLVAWISKKLAQSTIDAKDRLALRQVMCAMALASTHAASSSKRERLLSVLEALLLMQRPVVQLGLEWLAVLVGAWQAGQGLDGELTLACLCSPALPSLLSPKELDKYMALALEDLAANLASFAAEEKMTPSVANQLNRVHASWKEIDVDHSLMLIVRKAIFACQSGLTTEDAFMSHCCLSLTEILSIR